MALVIGLLVGLTPRASEACAGCSNPNLPTARSGTVGLIPGELAVTVNLSGTTMRVLHSEHCPDIGPICEQRAEPAQLHDQGITVAELRPILSLGLTRVFGLELQVPVRLAHTTIIFRRIDGTPFVPDYENIHHRNETLAGLGDPWVSARAAWPAWEWTVLATAGVTLPLGRTEPDPFARGAAGLEHQHLQFGTGTVNPVLGVDVLRRFGSLGVRAQAQAFLALVENNHGYQAGHRFLVGAGADLELNRVWQLGLGLDVLNEQPERWGGQIQQDGNVGRTDVLLGASARWQPATWAAILSVKVPVWQHFLEAGHTHGDELNQLTYPAIVNLAFETSFDVGR